MRVGLDGCSWGRRCVVFVSLLLELNLQACEVLVTLDYWLAAIHMMGVVLCKVVFGVVFVVIFWSCFRRFGW